MKVAFLALTVLASSAAPALAQTYDYRLISVPHAAIDQYLVPGSPASNTPANLQGLWWMDGNPLADKIVSFAGVNFTKVYKDGVEAGYECFLPVYDQGVWSWDDTPAGHDLYANVLQSRLTYHAVFNLDFTHGDVTPIIRVLPAPVPTLEVPQSLLLDFSMTQVNADEFSRDSVLLGQPFHYRFRRVVDGQSRRLPAYAEYLKSLEVRGLTNAWLPVCDDDASKALPTECSRH